MLCTKCGNPIAADETFCTACGAAAPAAEPVVETTAEPVVQAAANPGKGNGLTALILGIVSLSMSVVCGYLCIPSLVTGIIGFILGGKALTASAEAGFENKQAKTGKLLSIIGIAVSALAIVGWLLYIVLAFILGVTGSF